MPVRNFTRLLLWLCAILLVPLGAGLVNALSATASESPPSVLTPAPTHAPQPVIDSVPDGSETGPLDVATTIPSAALNTLKALEMRRGGPLPGYIGGRLFRNRERALPPGRYREYDVHPTVPGKNLGAERIVIDQRTGKAFYTADHYRSFAPMN